MKERPPRILRKLPQPSAPPQETIVTDIAAALAAARVDGLREGRRNARRELARELNRLEHQRADFFRKAEQTVHDIAIAVARQFINVAMSEADARAVITRTIRRHASSEPYMILTASDGLEGVRAALRDLKRQHPDAHVPRVHVDPSLNGNRAVLLTRHGMIDLDIESQLSALRASLADRTKSAPRHGS